MKNHNTIQTREKIPRKVKCGVVGEDELKMIKEALKKDSISKKKNCRKGLLNNYSDDPINISSNKQNKTTSTCIQSNKVQACVKEDNEKRNVPVNEKKESVNNQLNKLGLSHFMDLEERKDLLMSNVDDDPLSTNGPEAYDAIGWVPIKQEIIDDLEVSCVTITEIPLKPVEEQKRFSLEVTPTTISKPETDNKKIDNSVEVSAETEDLENNSNDEQSGSWCNEDEYVSDNKDGLEEEIFKPSSKGKPHSCDICDKKLSSKGSLRLHKKKKHQVNMKFTCELCSSDFDLQRDLMKHRNVAHRDSNGRFVCKDCGRSISVYYCFLVHLQTHFEEVKSFDGEDGPFKCDECDKCFNHEEGVSLHKVVVHSGNSSEKLKQQEKKNVCSLCGKRFAFGCLLRDHINLHTGTKPYLCQLCGRPFSQKASLKQHMRTHNLVRPFRCAVCNQGFFGKGDLKKHMRKHTGERPYVCEMCGDGFSQSSHLGVHRRSHTGERPFKCDICSRGFTKKGDVVRHRRIHTGELPYLCQVCGRSFRQSTQCSNHIKNHHPDVLVTSTKSPTVVPQWGLCS